MASQFSYSGQMYDISYFKTLFTSGATGQINYDSVTSALKEGSLSNAGFEAAVLAGYADMSKVEGFKPSENYTLGLQGSQIDGTNTVMPTTTTPTTTTSSTPTSNVQPIGYAGSTAGLSPNDGSSTQSTGTTQESSLSQMTQSALGEIANYNPSTSPQQNALNQGSVIMSQDAASNLNSNLTQSASNVQSATNALNSQFAALGTGQSPTDVYNQMNALTGNKRKKIGTQETKAASAGASQALLSKPTLLGL